MYTCFFSSSLATRSLTGVILVAVIVLVALCIRTGWTNELSMPHLGYLWRDDYGESRRAMSVPDLTPDAKPRGRKASSTCPGHLNEDIKQCEIGQWSWPFMAFIRNPMPDSHIQVEREKAEV